MIMKAHLELDLENPEIVKKSLEVDKEDSPRIKVKMKAEKKKLLIDIEAKDFSSLRAGLTSYLRLIKAALVD